MVDFFDKLYAKTIHFNTLMKKLHIDTLARVFIRYCSNLILPLYFIITSRNRNYRLTQFENDNQKYIVSFTSFPERINKVWLVVETILRQQYKPDMIILWLSKQQFHTINELPNNLIKLLDRGLTIELVDGDIRSYKKYFYALQKYPNDFIITIDDDIFYRKDMINTLLKTQQNLNYTNVIIANYAFKITYKNNHILSYNLWTNDSSLNDQIIGKDVFFGSGGGTLFSYKMFHSNVLNKDLFLKLAPVADDIWLNAMCRLSKTNICRTDYNSLLLPVIHKTRKRLCDLNVNNGMNDIQLNNVIKYCIDYYKINPFDNVS